MGYNSEQLSVMKENLYTNWMFLSGLEYPVAAFCYAEHFMFFVAEAYTTLVNVFLETHQIY